MHGRVIPGIAARRDRRRRRLGSSGLEPACNGPHWRLTMLAMRQTGQPRLLVCAVVVVAATVMAGGCAGPDGSRPATASTHRPTSARASGSPSTSPSGVRSPSASPWPLVISLPAELAGQHQTGTRPTADSVLFRAEMTDLWAGVVAGRPDLAMAAFFPLVAYEQVKAIPYPAADWRGRLVLDFEEDVMAAHDLIGHQARQATLVDVIVPEQEADW